MEPRIMDVCIVGGGFAGLVSALVLRQAGAEVGVIDRRTEANDPNRGDVLWPRAVESLRKWGVTFPAARLLTALDVDVDGKRGPRRDLAKGDELVFVPQPFLENTLRQAAVSAGVQVLAGWNFQSVLFDAAGRATGLSAVSPSDGTAFRAQLVVGADGRTSPLRDALGIRFKARDEDGEWLVLEAELPPSLAARPVNVVAYQVGAEGGSSTVYLSEKRVRVTLRLPVAEADRLSRLPAEVLAVELAGRHALPANAKVDPTKIRTYVAGPLGHAVTYVGKGGVIVGEAAHPAPPPSGQGFLMAVLDAEALGRLVGPALKAKDPAAVYKALDRYQLERWPVNEERLARARAAADWMSPQSAVKLGTLRTPMGRMAAAKLLATD